MDTQQTSQPTQPPVTRPPEQIINELRRRVEAGQALTREETREALAALRQSRMSAAESTSKAKKSAAPTRSASELLANLKNSVAK